MTASNSNFKKAKVAWSQNFIKVKQQKVHDIEYIKDTSTRRKENKETKEDSKGKGVST